MKIGRIFFLVALIISAVVLGGLLANLCQDVSFLSWLNYEQSIGLSIDNPAVSYTHLDVYKRQECCSPSF